MNPMKRMLPLLAKNPMSKVQKPQQAKMLKLLPLSNEFMKLIFIKRTLPKNNKTPHL